MMEAVEINKKLETRCELNSFLSFIFIALPWKSIKNWKLVARTNKIIKKEKVYRVEINKKLETRCELKNIFRDKKTCPCGNQ